jgi:hypothetical protein
MKELMFSGRCSGLRVLAALLVALGSARPLAAQTASEPALKAAFVYNFAKFTEWPSDALPDGAPLVMCVVGDVAVAQSLESAVKGRQVERHALVVQQLTLDGPLRTCHVLYAGDLNNGDAVQMLDLLRGLPVLVVSDLNKFARMGGTAQLFIEGDRMRFAINADVAQRNRLHLSSQLLALARLVKDDPDALPR